MNEHRQIRELLPLLASGDISPEDQRRVGEHLAGCDACRRLGEEYACVSVALRALSTPQPRPELVARVQALAAARLERKRRRSSETGIVALLVAGSWLVAFATWPLITDSSAWALNLWRDTGDGFVAILAFYSLAGLLLSFLAAFAVGRYAKLNGRTR
jgi:anti-sigma factor RsiW